jgi:hypothetical protein
MRTPTFPRCSAQVVEPLCRMAAILAAVLLPELTSSAQCQPHEIGQIQHPAFQPGGDLFAGSVSLSGATMAVADIFDSEKAIGAGAVYMFEKDASKPFGWTWKATLFANDFKPNHQFGVKLRVDWNTLAVGVPSDDDQGPSAGAVYIFQRSAAMDGEWRQVAKLIPTNGAPDENFGSAVSLAGNTCVIGAYRTKTDAGVTGTVYVFERSSEIDTEWIQVQRLLPDDASSGDRFGEYVSVRDDVLAVGATGQDEAGSGAGAIYVYELGIDGTLWEFSAKLTAPDAAVNDSMGPVSVASGLLVAGASGHDANGLDSGAAYVFRRSSAGWNPDSKLTAAGGKATEYYGSVVQVSGGDLVVTSPGDQTHGNLSGAAYVYRQYDQPGTWVQLAKLMPSDAASGDLFAATSASNGLIAIGAAKTQAPGVVYLFEPRLDRSVTTFCEPGAPQLPDCLPHIETVGSPSASGSGQFFIRSGNIPGGKLGVFLYTHAGLPSPIGSRPGLCLPTSTTGRSLFLGGNGTFGQCNGELVLDWNAFVQTQASVDPELAIPGTLIQGQFAYFGLTSSDPVGWTDAVAFVTCP